MLDSEVVAVLQARWRRQCSEAGAGKVQTGSTVACATIYRCNLQQLVCPPCAGEVTCAGSA